MNIYDVPSDIKQVHFDLEIGNGNKGITTIFFLDQIIVSQRVGNFSGIIKYNPLIEVKGKVASFHVSVYQVSKSQDSIVRISLHDGDPNPKYLGSKETFISKVAYHHISVFFI